MNLSEHFPTFRRAVRGIPHIIPSIARLPRRAAQWTVRQAPRLLVFILIIAVIHGAAVIIQGRRVQGKLAEIRAKGEPVTSAELGLPRVPDSENAAVVYEQAFSRLNNPDTRRDTDFLRKFLATDADNIEPETWMEAEAAAARLSPLISIVEEAVSRPKCQFSVNWEDGPRALFPHFAHMRELVLIPMSCAGMAARQGRTDDAIRLLELGFRSNEHLGSDPIALGMLVEAAGADKGLYALRRISAEGRISEAQARRLNDLLSDIDLAAHSVRAIQGERAIILCFFDQVRRSGQPGLMSVPGSMWDNIGVRLIRSYAYRPLLYTDQLVYLDHMSKQMKMMALPSHEAKRAEASLQYHIPRYTLISRMAAAPLFTGMAAKRDETIADIAGARISLGLMVYKNRKGSYPETLDPLRDEIGWDVPEDPFSGENLVYQRQGNGFILYSIGRNMRDDGGKVTPRSDAASMSRDEPMDDIAWRMAR